MAQHSKPAALAIGILLATSIVGAATTARAEASEATGKGIAGGALLGSEVVLITEALIGVKSPWILAASAVGGAIGGGVGGYFLEQNASPRVSFYALLGGMAFVIPTTIIYIDAVKQQPDIRNDNGDSEPFEDPDIDLARLDRDALSTPNFRGLLGVSPRGFALSVPSVDIRPMYTQAEVQQLGLTQGAQVMVPLVHALF